MNSSAFAVHAFDRGDLVRADSWFERYDDVEITRITPYLEPIFFGEVATTNGDGPMHCDVFIAPLLPPQVIASRELTCQRVESIARMARGMGNRVLGLGALLGVAADRAPEIESRVKGLVLTSGNALTAAAVVRGTLALAGEMSLDLTRHPVAVVGASGSLGRLCALMLSRSGCRITLVGRNRHRLSEVQREVGQRFERPVTISTDLDQAVRQSQAVVFAVSITEPFVQADLFAPGALLVDASQPKSVSKIVARSRPDLIWARGIYLEPPGQLQISCELRLPEGVLYPCLVETLLLGRLQPPDYQWVGRRIPLRAADWIWDRAEEFGFTVRPQMTETVWDC
jgi:predicted amino acid dehydrogenase